MTENRMMLSLVIAIRFFIIQFMQCSCSSDAGPGAPHFTSGTFQSQSQTNYAPGGMIPPPRLYTTIQYAAAVPAKSLSCGYPIEICTIETEEEDPCTISVYHLGLRGAQGNGNKRKIDHQPLLMVSSPISNPESWMLDYDGLAFYLLEKGYDVWLSTIRGNKNALKCRRRNSEDRSFWKFGFKELGEIDLKAAVDFIRSKTNGRKIQFISYSSSSLLPIILTNRYPEYCGYFSGYYMISPMIYGNNVTSSYAHLSEAGSPGIYSDSSQFVLNREATTLAVMVKSRYEVKRDMGADCSNPIAEECQDFFRKFWGGSNSAVNHTKFELWLEKAFNGYSVRTMATILQWTRLGKFSDFYYGCPKLNLRFYNQTTPPEWDMKICPDVRLTVAAWSGDSATDSQSILRFSRDVSCGNSISVEPNKNFGHGTFIYGNNLMENFNKKIFDELFSDYRDFVLHDSTPGGQLGPQHSQGSND